MGCLGSQDLGCLHGYKGPTYPRTLPPAKPSHWAYGCLCSQDVGCLDSEDVGCLDSQDVGYLDSQCVGCVDNKYVGCICQIKKV
eukprot:399963-Amorphochlora_amoeboformis.AAC.1